jgi:hypothetical protein
LGCQNGSAVVDAIIRNDHDKNPARPNPSPDVLQEQPFHTPVLPFADLKVVRWVEIHEREGLYRGMSIEGAALDHLIEELARFVRTVSIEFDTVSPNNVRTVTQRAQRRAGPGTRIKDTYRDVGKLQIVANARGFGCDERVIPAPQFGF